MKTYENNMADQALIVKSIKVLENIEGGGITEIRNNIDAMRKQQSFQGKKQEEYWTALSSDGIVSPVEKQSLLREMENIKRSEAAILSQAATYGYTGLVLQDYIATYNDLRDYIYVTLKLFEDMNSETVIEDRDTFNTKFSQYYYSENFVLLAITAGILDTINIRVLQSLNESGTEGEIAIYRGAVYQFQNDVWKNVTTGAYKGPCTELPESEDGAFFIVSESFTITDVLYVNDEEFYVNGDVLGITRTFIKGMIYYCNDGIWYIEENTKDWKYTAAFADVINITGELPALFQAAFDELQAGIDDLQSQIGQINTHVPVYLGASSSIPTGQEGDYFVYSGGSTGSWVKSMVYRYTNGSWEQLDPTNTAYRNYYMMALEDILATQVTGEGYFSTIFALAFFANSATLQSLSVRTIYLSSYGTIQSDLNTYSPGRTGLRIDANGNIDANQNTHIGGICNIDGDTTIGGTCTINSNGSINGDISILGRAVIGGRAIFRGEIESGPLHLNNNTPAPSVVTYPAGTDIGNQIPFSDLDGITDVDGTYGNVQFDTIRAGFGGTGQSIYTYLHLYKEGNKVYDGYFPGYTHYYLLFQLSYTVRIPASSKTFKLIGIPTAKPQTSNYVYVDENGFLKLS